MQSIFDLKTSLDQLESSNNGVTKDSYEKLTATRDVFRNNFSNGSINFKWTTAQSKWWIPNKTYIRMRVELSDLAGTSAIGRSRDIAPCMNQMATLFQSAEFKINDRTVSKIGDFLAQVDTIDTRMNKSRGWLNSVGASTNFWESYWHVRQSEVTIDGEIYDGDGPALTAKRNLRSLNPANAALTFDDGITPTTITVATTGLVTFSGGPPTSEVFIQGDQIEIASTVAGNGNLIYYVAQTTGQSDTLGTAMTANQMRLVGPCKALGATADPWFLTRNINCAKESRYYEITWCPPLSIFKIMHAIPSGKFELVLQPHPANVIQTIAVESSRVDASSRTPVEYRLSVVDMYLYISTIEGARAENTTYYLDLEQTSCQAQQISGNSYQQKNFDVSPATKQLCIAFQDRRAGTDTRYSVTRFRSYVDQGFEQSPDFGLYLSRLLVNYAGINKPDPSSDPRYEFPVFLSNDNRDWTTQGYIDSLLASGGYHDTGGSETLEEWQRRGAYYLFNWNKDKHDRSTRVAVHTEFSSPLAISNTRMLLFSVASQVAKIVISNGYIDDVQVMDN
jgi:hypothetical protein